MRSVFILFSLVPLIALTNTLDSVRAEQRAEGLFVIHKVEEDETLFSLARRYKCSVQTIIDHNGIEDNRIDIGQQIEVLYEEVKEEEIEKPSGRYHQVVQGETLYSISKKYDLRLKDLRRWNDLSNNAISPGQYLKLEKASTSTVEIASQEKPEAPKPDSVYTTDYGSQFKSINFDSYLVQTGETIASIAEKIGVSVEQLMDWNDLTSTYLKIGQELNYVNEKSTMVESGKTAIDEEGFKRVYEEGIAAEIGEIKTRKYLALHRSLPVGTELAVRNLMNNLVVHVKVVGRLPDTGINKSIMLRLSPPAYDRLGILDPKSRVEVSYYK